MPTDRYDAPSAMAWSSQSAPTMQRFLLSSRQSVWTAPAMNSVCTGSGTYFTRRRNASRMTCILSRAPVGLPPSTSCRVAHARTRGSLREDHMRLATSSRLIMAPAAPPGWGLTTTFSATGALWSGMGQARRRYAPPAAATSSAPTTAVETPEEDGAGAVTVGVGTLMGVMPPLHPPPDEGLVTGVVPLPPP